MQSKYMLKSLESCLLMYEAQLYEIRLARSRFVRSLESLEKRRTKIKNTKILQENPQ